MFFDKTAVLPQRLDFEKDYLPPGVIARIISKMILYFSEPAQFSMDVVFRFASAEEVHAFIFHY